jgi:MFS family permease
LETEKGVKHVYWGILLYIFATILVFVGVLFTFVFIEDIIANEPPPGEVPENLGIIAGALGLMCGGALLIIITLILWLLGLYEMHQGKDEFGPEHSGKVSKAIIFIVLYIVLLVLGVVVGLVVGLSSSVNYDAYLESLRTLAVLGSITDTISTIFLGLAIVYLVFELSDEKHQNILWMGFVALVIISIIGRIITIVPLYGESLGTDVSDLRQIEALTSLAMGLSFIPFLLFLIAYRHAYIRVKEGEIKPVPGAQAQMYPTAAYPQQYPAQQYAPQQYQQPARVCPACGGPTSPGEAFCANCGARLQ